MQRDTIHLHLADGRDIHLIRVRDPRAKRIKLTVNERGARLTLPLRANLDAANAFVEQHRDWLAAQLHVCHQAAPLLPNVTTHLPLRGQQVPVEWQRGRFIRVMADQGRFYVSCPDNARPAALARTLHDCYATTAHADIARWLPHYLPGLPRPPKRIHLRILSSQWGSLAPDGSVRLDLALLLGPPFAFEYVLVHELCHLIHANHSHAFWQEVEIRCPDWQRARDYLRAHGRALKGQLHALLRG